jgi:hypothetical protein
MGDKEQVDAKQQQAPAEAQPAVPLPANPPPPQYPAAAATNPENPEKISKSDRIMAAATVVIAVGTLVSAGAICFQWREMVKGGTDTSALVGYAQRQADDADKIKLSADKQAVAAQGFADTAVLTNGGIGDAVKKLDAQAKATQSSARNAETALIVSERAYLAVGINDFSYDTKSVLLPIVNTGHIPAGRGKTTIHEMTVSRKPVMGPDDNGPIEEMHWSELDKDWIENKEQKVFIVGKIVYNDGFPNTKERTAGFCFTTDVRTIPGKVEWYPCEWSAELPISEKLDKYPSPQYRTPQ